MARKPAASAKARKTKSAKAKTPARKPAPKAKAKPAPKPKAKARPAPKAYATRADLNAPGDAAIERFPEPQRAIARAADTLIRRTLPGVTSLTKWGNACYYLEGKAVAALYHTKAGVNLALAGAGVPDPQGLLQGSGKAMRHVKLSDPARVPSPAIAELIRASSRIGLPRM